MESFAQLMLTEDGISSSHFFRTTNSIVRRQCALQMRKMRHHQSCACRMYLQIQLPMTRKFILSL
eukprot:scaffold4167_cov91-Skeletonema_menzelii.AAC.1